MQFRIIRPIHLILLLALTLRLLWAAFSPESALSQLPDQQQYLALGRSLIHTHSLSLIDPRFNQRVYAYRTPGYPLLVAAAAGNLQAIRILQAILDTSTVLAAYLIARRLLPTRIATLAAAFVAINPFLIYFTGLILTETAFTAAIAWATCLLLKNQKWWGGLILAFAALIRPEAILIGPILALLAHNLNPSRHRPYHFEGALRDVALVIALTFLLLLPWAWRNHRILGQWIWTSTNDGITLYDGLNPQATGASDQRFLAHLPQLRPITEVQRNAELRQMAAQWATTHPRQLLPLTLAKIARTWSPIPLSDQFGRASYRLIAAAYAIPLDLLVLFALFKRHSPLTVRAKLYLLATAGCLTLAHALTVGSLRYRLAAEPPLCVLAAASTARKPEIRNQKSE